jgi:hypothetical protein
MSRDDLSIEDAFAPRRLSPSIDGGSLLEQEKKRKEDWDKLMNAPIMQPGHVYVEHDNEKHTGEWMNGDQVNALVRRLGGFTPEPEGVEERRELASFLRTVAQSFGCLSNLENEQRKKVQRAATLLVTDSQPAETRPDA